MLDEFDAIYKRPRLNGIAFVQTLLVFGNQCNDHRLRFYVSGSSACLRGLCYCELPAALTAP